MSVFALHFTVHDVLDEIGYMVDSPIRLLVWPLAFVEA